MKRIRKNNSGMALVSVIVVIGFIAALVSIVLATTLVNFKMRIVNERSKDTFYSAEQALDEINIGLQRFMSDSMSEAYIEVLESNTEYSITDSMSEDQKEEIKKKRNELLRVRFYEGLWEKLGYGDHRDQYDVEILDSFLKDSTRWHGDEEDGYGAILLATDAEDDTLETKVGKMITYQEEGVVLKDLKVYYKDAAGFVSVIKTDIRMDYPGFSFDRSTEIPEIVYYSFIADEQATIKCDTVNTEGKIYANQLTIDGCDVSSQAGDEIYIKYDLDLKANSSFTSAENTVLWAKNIIADSSSVSLDGTVNVANDVNLKGNSSSFVTKGSFTGFGNSTENSYKSSSILLNGIDSSIDVSKATSFVLGGHAFAGTSKSKKFTTNELDSDIRYSNNARVKLKDLDNTDVFMTESIAPKYNQMFYLVPANAIGVVKDTKESYYKKNPLTLNEYKAINTGVDPVRNVKIVENANDIDEIALDVSLSELSGNDLSSFVKTENDGSVKVNRVFVRTSDETSTGGALVYYYMDFDQDEAMARDYFSLYYSNNQEAADKFMDCYINQILVPDASASDLNIAGTYFEGSKDDEGYSKYYGINQSNSVKMTDLCNDKYETYKRNVYCENGSDIADTFEQDVEANRKAFINVVSETNFSLFVNTLLGDDFDDEGDGIYPIKDSAGNSVCSFEKAGTIIKVLNADGDQVALLCNDSSTIGSSLVTDTTCLIISKGNVELSSDFNGLIICHGKVNFEGASVNNICADPSAVKEALDLGFYKADTHEKVYLYKVIKDSSDFGGDGDDDLETKTLGEMISYENWTKY